ncbi:MAG: dihydroorotate dehydrogenase [Alyxoria varia]|nr:MAG: dihydroorotate dehydrogenase [Alyxoria varia]
MPLNFDPPLLNSSSPWATTKEELQDLYRCPHTGAVTTRTALINGFSNDPERNRYVYFDCRNNNSLPERSPNANSTLNTLGYSPLPLQDYLSMIQDIVAENPSQPPKPFIVSVSGTTQDVANSLQMISQLSARESIPLLMEINISCPNISDQSLPSFSNQILQQYLSAAQQARTSGNEPFNVTIPVGLKVPPYTYHEQFLGVIESLLLIASGADRCPIDFLTTTNTLGNCIVMEEAGPMEFTPSISSASGMGMGGLGGCAIHPLSLGNVRTFRSLLDQHEALKHIEIIGVGGVSDCMGFGRMRSVGASVVAVGTALGKEGLEVFHKIMNELTYGGRLQGVVENGMNGAKGI